MAEQVGRATWVRQENLALRETEVCRAIRHTSRAIRESLEGSATEESRVLRVRADPSAIADRRANLAPGATSVPKAGVSRRTISIVAPITTTTTMNPIRSR